MDITECGAANPEDPIEPKVFFIGPARATQNQTAFGATQKVADPAQCVSKEEWVVGVGGPSFQFEPTCSMDFAISNRTRNQGQCHSD
jgi:hypothetical protein